MHWNEWRFEFKKVPLIPHSTVNGRISLRSDKMSELLTFYLKPNECLWFDGMHDPMEYSRHVDADINSG